MKILANDQAIVHQHDGLAIRTVEEGSFIVTAGPTYEYTQTGQGRSRQRGRATWLPFYFVSRRLEQ